MIPSRRLSIRTICLLVAGLALSRVLLTGCSHQTTTQKPPPRSTTSLPSGRGAVQGDNSNLLLGNPSRADGNPNNFLVERAQYSLSYNAALGGPNWVAWHLEKSDLGEAERSDFLPDPDLPPVWQIRPADYRGSGYDRGHVCPSGDRTRSKRDNLATFVMSNMLPQTAALNQHLWKGLEDYSRSLTRTNEIYVMAGGIGSQGRIAKGRVNVPKACWKVLVVLPRGDDDLARIDADTRVIAVIMPNQESPEIASANWKQYLTNIAEVERATGYNLLAALPAQTQRALKQKVDSGRASR